MEKTVRKATHIMCTWADDSSKRAYITRGGIRSLLARQGGRREARPLISYMTVTVLEDGTRDNCISVWGVDDTPIADIAYSGARGGWFICG